MMPKFSIIIPVIQINDYIHESIRYILSLDYQNFEVLIFPDQKSRETFPKTRIIPTRKIGPAGKRNLALKHARGEILAFLDDDAYPKRDWLSWASKNFENSRVAALGGPAITPPSDSILQKTSGACLSAFMISGPARDRYLPGKKRKMIYDWPSVNFFIRKKKFEELGGFKTKYWPGEDTELCLSIIKRGGKIIYDPKVVVCHHRRQNLFAHLKQIGGYGLHRGFFAKKFPETSLKLFYFIPSLFLIFVILSSIVILIFPYSLIFYFIAALWVGYAAGIIGSSLAATVQVKNPMIGLLVIPYIFLTHIAYGARFIQGLIFTKKLKSTLRGINQ